MTTKPGAAKKEDFNNDPAGDSDDNQKKGDQSGQNNNDDQTDDSDDSDSSKKGQEGGDDDDLEKWNPKEVKNYIKELRNENKKHRQRAKSVEEKFDKLSTGLKKALGVEDDEDMSPEETIDKLSSSNESMKLQLAIRDTALSMGIGGDDYEYFEFLMGKKLNDMGEDEEMDEDAIQEIAQKVQARSGSSSQKKTSTSVGTGKKDGTEPDGTSDGDNITAEQFSQMNTGEKSAIYQKTPELYDKLFKECVARGLI